MAVSIRCTTRSVRRGLSYSLVPVWLVAVLGCEEQLSAPIPLEVENAEAEAETENNKKLPRNNEVAGCRVSGRIVSTAWRDRGGRVELAIVSAWKLPESIRVAETSREGEEFEIHLPPGKYRLVCSAVGTRGATFDVLDREISVADGHDHLEVDQVDLPISKSTGLYGQAAPELDGIVAWQDTQPIALKDLKGKVVVLDFFAHYCSICHAHKPELAKLIDTYGPRGVIVLAIHDPRVKTLDEMNEKMGLSLRQAFHGEPPRLPMALDGPGERSVFNAYGIYAVPAIMLIDQQGRVVRRYHHAGKPELEADVRKLLNAPSKNQR